MTLVELRTKLESAATATNVETVLFNYSEYLNYAEKDYPLVLWDLDNMTGIKNRKEDRKVITIDCYILGLVTPEDDEANNRHAIWDELEGDLEMYLYNVNEDDDLSIENLLSTSFEYYPAGLFSLEREMGLRFQVVMKLWCSPPGD